MNAHAVYLLTCVTCSLPVKTGNYTCFYAASTLHKIHAIALNKARKLQVTSPAWCRLTYQHFAGEFTSGVLFLCGNFFLRLKLFLPAFGGYFDLRFECFCLQVARIFACRSIQFCMLVAGKFPWVPHVKWPVNCLWCSSKFTCANSRVFCARCLPSRRRQIYLFFQVNCM